MKESAITIAIYNSSFIVFACSVFFYFLVTVKHEGNQKNDLLTSVGLLISNTGMMLFFLWIALWRVAHASRDASVWMIDHPFLWFSSFIIMAGSVITLRGLTTKYWLLPVFVGALVFFSNLL